MSWQYVIAGPLCKASRHCSISYLGENLDGHINIFRVQEKRYETTSFARAYNCFFTWLNGQTHLVHDIAVRYMAKATEAGQRWWPAWWYWPPTPSTSEAQWRYLNKGVKFTRDPKTSGCWEKNNKSFFFFSDQGKRKRLVNKQLILVNKYRF